MDHNKLQHLPPNRQHSRVDRLLRLLAVYVIPAVMVLVSVLAAIMLERMYPNISGTLVPLRVLPTSESTTLDPHTAYQTLRDHPVEATSSSGKNSWLLMHLPPQRSFADFQLEIPSRHITGILCWNPKTMDIIGNADRTAAESDIRMSKLGFNISVGRLTQAMDVLCYGTFTQDAQVKALIWPTQQFRQIVSKYDHDMGQLEGGLLTPAIFTLLIALITREHTYALLAAWLIANLRLGAFAIGWDSQWLGYLLPLDAMPLIRHMTIASYYLLTVALLARLLRANHYTRHPYLLALTQWSAILMLVAAMLLPGAWFWPLIGLNAIFGLIVAVYLITRAWTQTSLVIWFWQMTSLALAFSFIIGLAGLLIFGDINNIDSMVATGLMLISSAAMILTLAERLRNRRSEQQRLHTELITSYAITPIGMFTLDNQDRFLRINPVLENILGFTIAERPDAKWTDFFPKLDWAELEAKTKANKDVEITARANANDSTTHHYAIRAITIDKTVEGSLQDISAHTALIEQLRVMAGKDPVTEALNQRGIEQAISEAIEQLQTNTPASLACLSISHFTSINNLFGATTGDALLIKTRKKISELLKITHSLGRVSSDEFAILFPGKSAEDMELVVHDMVQDLNRHLFTIGAHAINVKIAVGLIDLSPELANANEALFAAGRACRDASKDPEKIVTYKQGSALLREHRELLRLFDQLEAGMTPDGFRLEMQPMLSMRNHERAWSFEVLLRVKDSEGSNLSPGRFIAAAEDIGTITIIDKWVLEETLTWLDHHIRSLPHLHLLSINLSGVSLNSEPFIEHLFRLLNRYQHLSKYLIIEMTEGVALEDLERSQNIMHRLQEMGVHIGLDDFGSGYTSFSYLRNLNADLIKIDGTLIQNMLADHNNIAIVQSIIQLARQLKMKCIAEWVEDIETLTALHRMGVDYIQGYIVAPSMPLENIVTAESINDFIKTDDCRNFVHNTLKLPRHPNS